MRFVTPEAAEVATMAVSLHDDDDARVQAVAALEAAEKHIAGAVMDDFMLAFKRSAVEANLNTILLHNFSQIIEAYKKGVTENAG